MSATELFRIAPRYDMPSYLWPRPKYRGVLHALGAFAVVPLGALLVDAASGTTARVAATVYVLAQLVVFATSASYHRLAKSPTARRRMQLADHSMIYLLIAGTWAPVCLLVLPGASGRVFLAGVVAAGAVGIVLKSFGIDRFPRSSNAMYGVMGGAALLALPGIVGSIDLPTVALLALGGLVYAGGAMVLLFKRPDPLPSVFGYHEIWHACTVGAAACHFAMVWLIVT
ncbi:MAG TPA: hemolysin III family protein [Acidimicrobiales bacterium]|nr:hemolysin III family protein [Acidimicrobiales bacterium]